MNILNVTNPKFVEATGVIECTVETAEYGLIPFAASAVDVEEHGRKIYADLLAGVYGPIAPYVAPVKTQAELIAEALVKYDAMTSAFIQSKITAYNISNGVSFANIDSFTKYAMITSDYTTIAIRFIIYADAIWKALRTYQSTLTVIPTEAEVQVVLDSVVF